MAEKMVNCKACGKEIAKSTRVCPGCGKRNKKPLWQTILIILAALIFLSIIANTGGGSKKSETATVSQNTENSSGSENSETAGVLQNTKNSSGKPQTKANFIKAGMYKVGSEIAAGEYVVESTGSLGYYQISSDSTGEFGSIIVNDNLNRGEFGYVIVQNGDYIKLQDCRMYLSADKNINPANLGKIPSSTYKIGKDLPAGEYKLTVKRQPAYWERSKNPRDNMFSIIANDMIENSAYVRVSEGEYFKITGIEAALVE
jgi:RNA polymerase subunit RPABC4/transcription elongation factor Spt4